MLTLNLNISFVSQSSKEIKPTKSVSGNCNLENIPSPNSIIKQSTSITYHWNEKKRTVKVKHKTPGMFG